MLYNNFLDKHLFSGIVKINILFCGPNSVIGNIYFIIYFINYSCLLNTYNNWNSDIKYETIHAIRYINTGKEITISYNKGGLFDFQRSNLKDVFGFDYNYSFYFFLFPEL